MSILDFELPENDAEAKTVREYLCRLLLKVWHEDEGFSGKRPFGNSGWTYELTEPLVEVGIADDTNHADTLLTEAIIEMCS